jgi:hypothetical protein
MFTGTTSISNHTLSKTTTRELIACMVLTEVKHRAEYLGHVMPELPNRGYVYLLETDWFFAPDGIDPKYETGFFCSGAEIKLVTD